MAFACFSERKGIMTIHSLTPWKLLARNIQQYWIGNRETSLRSVRLSVAEALSIHPDELIIYDEREVIVSYLRKQAVAIRSRFAAGPRDTTMVIVNEVADAVDAIAQRIQNGEHIESMVGYFAMSPRDIKALKRARDGHDADADVVTVENSGG